MCRRSFPEEGLVKLLNLGHVHVDAEQPFNFPCLLSTRFAVERI